MTTFYELKITGPELERTEIHYTLDRAQDALQALVKTFSSEHTVDLKSFTVELLESIDCQGEEPQTYKGSTPSAIRRSRS